MSSTQDTLSSRVRVRRERRVARSFSFVVGEYWICFVITMKRLILDFKRRIYGKIVVPRWQSTVLMKRTCIWTVIDAFSGRTVHHNVLGSHAYGNSNTTQKALFVAVFMSIELAASIAEDERINLLERKLTNSKRLSNGLCIFQSQKEIVKYVVRNRYYSSSSFIILLFFFYYHYSLSFPFSPCLRISLVRCEN